MEQSSKSPTFWARDSSKRCTSALLHELRLRGIRAIAQASLTIRYKEQYIGEYYADLLVEDVLLVELKCVDRLANEHTA